MSTITFQQTREDMVDAARLHAMAYVLGWRRLPLMFVFMIGVMVLSFVMLSTRGRDPIMVGAVAVALRGGAHCRRARAPERVSAALGCEPGTSGTSPTAG